MDIKEVLPYTYKIFSNMLDCTESSSLYVYQEYVNVQCEELHFKQRQKLSRHICNQSCSIDEGKQHSQFSLWMITQWLRTQSSQKLKNLAFLLEVCSFRGTLLHFWKFSAAKWPKPMKCKRPAIISKGLLLTLPRMSVFCIYIEGCRLFKPTPATSNIQM